MMKPLFFTLSLLACLSAAPFARAQTGAVWNAVAKTAAKQSLAHSSVTTLSRQAQRNFHAQILNLFQPPRTLPLPAQQTVPQATFRVHRAGMPYANASAFAVETNGKIFGVTAGHVMRSVAQMDSRKTVAELEARGLYMDVTYPLPQMRIQKPDGSFVSQNIVSWQLSNTHGTDVAVFEIPADMLPWIHPLPLSTRPASVWQTVSISGFADDRPLLLSNEEILFTTPFLLLLRNSFSENINGLCGSPVMADGKVIGLYTGAHLTEPQNFLSINFPKDMPSDLKTPSLHRAAPISNIFPLINKLTGETQPAGLPLKLFGNAVAFLQPEESVAFVYLVRNGIPIDKWTPGDLLDPEHLENLFELQENDILRLVIFTKTYTAKHDAAFLYEVNVSTGQVVRKDTL